MRSDSLVHGASARSPLPLRGGNALREEREGGREQREGKRRRVYRMGQADIATHVAYGLKFQRKDRFLVLL